MQAAQKILARAENVGGGEASDVQAPDGEALDAEASDSDATIAQAPDSDGTDSEAPIAEALDAEALDDSLEDVNPKTGL